MNKKFTAKQISTAAQEALDNWEFDNIDTGDGEKQRKVLEDIVRKGGFSVEVYKFFDIFDFLAEYASATSAGG
mgnify:FL=1